MPQFIERVLYQIAAPCLIEESGIETAIERTGEHQRTSGLSRVPWGRFARSSGLLSKLETSLEKGVYNLHSLVRDNNDSSVDDLIEEVDCIIAHSTADAKR